VSPLPFGGGDRNVDRRGPGLPAFVVLVTERVLTQSRCRTGDSTITSCGRRRHASHSSVRYVPRLIEPVLYHKARELGVTIHQVGGMEGHLHAVVTNPLRVAVRECIRQFKGASSYAVRWQDGHGALTVGARSLASVIDYVGRQREHHSAGSVLPALERCEPNAPPPRQPVGNKG